MLSPRDNRQILEQNDGADDTYPVIVIEIKEKISITAMRCQF